MANLTTELEAVNLILGTVGQQPVNALDDSRADVRIAQNILSEISRTVQAEGWRFNTEYEVPLPLNVDGEIELGNNVIRVEVKRVNLTNQTPVMRGQKLYDAYNRTYVFTAPLKASIVYLLDFNDLPEAARNYIAVRTARVYQQRFLGVENIYKYSLQEELLARANMLRHESDTGNYTVFDNNSAIDRKSFRNRKWRN